MTKEQELLLRAKAIMDKLLSFHIDSVKIGALSDISYSGIIDREMTDCRKYVEQADLLGGEIAALFSKQRKKQVKKT